MNVLQHLGLRLYSNVPAVLSEVVANAWDADAKNVEIELDLAAKRIVIRDDGTGMVEQDINSRFLYVGYSRREMEQGQTALGRDPMGRKGIGKLSLFSIADKIVVETARGGGLNALCMSLSGIKEAITKQSPSESGQYEPKELPTDKIDFEHGTRITLTGLRRLQTASTAKGLRQRLARRFSIIGPANEFNVVVNGEAISPADRGYSNQIQYAWAYGDEPVAEMFRNLANSEDRDGSVTVPGQAALDLSGWLGTVREAKQLRDESGDSLNRIAIFVRGRMAQEDILGDFGEKGVYAGYLIGELHVNGLDRDDQEDSATSGRQRILEDDPRYVALKRFIKKELSHIEVRWQALRGSRGVDQAEKIPEVKDWIKQLPPQNADQARQWIGRVYRLRVDEPSERRELLKQAIVGFEFYRWNESLKSLDSIADSNLEAAIDIFRQLDMLEANAYGKTVKSRIEVIRTLQQKVDAGQKERAIQEYIYDHLWLLDPNWERIEGSERMETEVGKLFKELDKGLTKEEKAGRIDINYRQVAGKHVVIELKKPDRRVSVYDLAKQIGKYRTGMRKLLDNAGRKHELIEFICLIGDPPREQDAPDGMSVIEKTLEAQGARYVTYNALLDNAYGAYRDYLAKSKDIDRLSVVMSALDKSSETVGFE